MFMICSGRARSRKRFRIRTVFRLAECSAGRAGPRLVPHHGVVAEQHGDGRAFRQRLHLRRRLRLQLGAVPDDRRTDRAAGRSEPAVPQPLGKLAAIARTTSRRFQHFPLNVIGLLQGFEPLEQPAEPLSGAAAGEQQQEDRGDRQREAQRAREQAAATEGGEKAGDHRRPRFQSSSRA